MNNCYHLINAKIVNEGNIFDGEVVIKEGVIDRVIEGNGKTLQNGFELIDIKGNYLIPGVIDDQVHFREPGLTHKGDIYSESRAAVAGGITSFMEMPNTNPPALTIELLEEKYCKAQTDSFANYSFYLGASNDNINEIEKVDPRKVCGVKVFMGASTGNMLVDDPEALKNIFSRSPVLVATHCEDEDTIRANQKLYKEKFGEDVPVKMHPVIRSEEACYKSSSYAVALAKKYNTRLHVLHLSTKKELQLFDSEVVLSDKRITSEVCVHHLSFCDDDYDKLGTLIKWNPAIKTRKDQEGLLAGLQSGKIDVVATDHAPHTLQEKQNSYFKAPSGGPLVQHSLIAMLGLYHKGILSLEQIIEKMCHNPAVCFNVEKRGFIREGYWADLTVVDLETGHTVDGDNILYKCGWSPFQGKTFHSSVVYTFVNGQKVFDNGVIDEGVRGKRLLFNR